MAGYSYREGGEVRRMPPLWRTQIPVMDDHLEIGFRDLVELRFVKAFVEAGVGLNVVRRCLDYARELINDPRPLATQRFKTDGRTIFLESLDQSDSIELLDLKRHQYVLPRVIDRTFRDLDIEDDVVVRWRPFKGKNTIVVDPERSFGQPIAARHGVPTAVLADAVEAEGSVDLVSALYQVPAVTVRDSVRFEQYLRAA